VRHQIVVCALGIWLTAAPAVLGFGEPAQALGRIVGPILASLGAIAAFDLTRALRWAAIPTGVLAACIALVPPFVSWPAAASTVVTAALVVWLTFATPPSRGAYGSGTEAAGERSPTPPGWDYNPSSWAERLPLAIVALVGAGIAGYLAAFQYGWVRYPWDPFFGDGSRTILTSSVSRVLPIPDAALGALGYLVDAITAVVGGRSRWRTMPWIVIVFGIAVGPLGAISILLVILQPVVFHAWCTLCLTSAVISVLMIGPSMDEVVAGAQHVMRLRRRGASTWQALRGTDAENW
jgi:hypothetical protein